MIINGISGIAQTGSMSVNQNTDSVSKGLQEQITNAQEQLQELSANKDMSIEEKMEKRQEIQQQISTLNQQLRQHQIEARKHDAADDMQDYSARKKSSTKETGLSASSMQSILSADASIEQVEVQSQVKTSLEGRAGVLKSEIKFGMGNVEAKKEELADVEAKASGIESAQMSALSDINRELARTNADSSDKEKAVEEKDDVGNVTEISVEKSVKKSAETNGEYVSVDVRL